MITLPPWNDSMSDGCSVPKWLRFTLPLETPEQIEVCRRHDEAYYYGGSEEDHAIADAIAFIGWIRAGMPVENAMKYFMAVRQFGAPQFRQPGVSWAFGGERFCYGEKAVAA